MQSSIIFIVQCFSSLVLDKYIKCTLWMSCWIQALSEAWRWNNKPNKIESDVSDQGKCAVLADLNTLVIWYWVFFLSLDRQNISVISITHKIRLCSYRKVLKEAHQHEIKNCDVVLCTCASALKPEIREVMDFRQILIDECAMATEPEAFIPLVSYKPQQVSSRITSLSPVSDFKWNKRHNRSWQVEEICNLQQIFWLFFN